MKTKNIGRAKKWSRVHVVVLVVGVALSVLLIGVSSILWLKVKKVAWGISLLLTGGFTMGMSIYGYFQLREMYNWSELYWNTKVPSYKRKGTGWKKLLTHWYGLLGFVWSLPVSLPYALYVFFFVLLGQYRFVRRYGWTLEFETVYNSWVHKKYWEGKWSGANGGAITVYSHLYVNNEDTQDHERRHAWQVFCFGFYGVFIYAIHSIYLYASGKDGYRDVFLEEEARRAEHLDH